MSFDSIIKDFHTALWIAFKGSCCVLIVKAIFKHIALEPKVHLNFTDSH